MDDDQVSADDVRNALTTSPDIDSDGASDKNQTRSQAEWLIELALDSVSLLFHAPDETPYAVAPVTGRQQVLELRTKGFRSLLYRLFYDKFRKPPGSQAVEDALRLLEAKARLEGPRRDVYVRLAEHEGRIYLDLADETWRVVEVDADGWRLLDRSPVMFRRPKGLAPLPVPVAGGSLDELRAFVNIDDSEWPLLVGFLLACVNPRGPYPLLVIVAEQGAGKSALAKLLKSIVDANLAPLRSAPRDERDLMIAAINSWILSFDNLSGVSPMLSDALCRLSTGGGYATRELYANSEETILDAMRPVILTGIDDLATRADLLDRSIILSLPRIKPADRITERELVEGFKPIRPRVLGALLTAASAGLRNLPRTNLESKPRMADFATWAVAAEPGTDLEPGAFLRAYRENRASANALALDVSPLPGALQVFMTRQRGEWEGTAGELLTELDQRAEESTRRSKAWPKSASSISQKVRRIAPNLRESGIEVDFIRTSTTRLIRISTENAVTPVTPSPTGHEPRQAQESRGDGNDDGTESAPVTPSPTPSQHETRPARERDGNDDDDGALQPFSRSPGGHT